MSAPVKPSGRRIDSQEQALTVVRAALEKHAEHVTVLDLRSLSTVTDFFVVCTAGSARQINALKEHIETTLHRRGWPVWHTEGTAPASVLAQDGGQTPQWVLLDCGDVVVHLLDQQARALYRLEELWADAPRLPLA
jgi:ribosome-associated protein